MIIIFYDQINVDKMTWPSDISRTDKAEIDVKDFKGFKTIQGEQALLCLGEKVSLSPLLSGL